MILDLYRLHDTGDETYGLFYVDGELQCFALEDQHQTKKVWGETRIPAGSYTIRLRRHGGFHEKYALRFPGLHKGMLEIAEVPGFSDVLIHVGNDDGDTAGCVLVGNAIDLETKQVLKSVAAYKALYKLVLDDLLAQFPVTLNIYDPEDWIT